MRHALFVFLIPPFIVLLLVLEIQIGTDARADAEYCAQKIGWIDRRRNISIRRHLPDTHDVTNSAPGGAGSKGNCNFFLKANTAVKSREFQNYGSLNPNVG